MGLFCSCGISINWCYSNTPRTQIADPGAECYRSTWLFWNFYKYEIFSRSKKEHILFYHIHCTLLQYVSVSVFKKSQLFRSLQTKAHFILMELGIYQVMWVLIQFTHYTSHDSQLDLQCVLEFTFTGNFHNHF